MIFLASMLLGWSEIARLLRLRERIPGVGDGTIEGHRYTVIQRGNEIYVILPDHPRDKCEEMVRRILQRLRPDAEIKIDSVGYASGHCNYCLASFSLTYRCHRCGGWYCSEHRLPERHNCPNGGTGIGTRRQQPKETRRTKEKAKKEEIIAVQLPCA